jgi:hypothetical protein
MSASWDQKHLTERLVHEKDLFACHLCGSKSFVIYDAFWPSKTNPRTLEVQGNCAECDAGALIALSVKDAKRCGFIDPDEDAENVP